MYDKSYMKQFSSYTNLLALMQRYSDFRESTVDMQMAASEVFVENTIRTNCYLLKSGYVQITDISKYGATYLMIGGPGKIISLPICNAELPQLIQIKALTNVVITQVDFEFLKKVLQLEDPHNYVTINYLSDLRKMLYHEVTQNTVAVRGRIIKFLVYLADSLGMRAGDYQVWLPHFLTYEVLAEFAHCSKPHAVTILKELRGKGIIDTHRGQWAVLDIRELQGLLDE
ncbi:Crp/Fnr family transcriptional regulator [Listeria booriae]|uniref:Crp/Fnr family transcriptional regulator n=1 Tax=Listeria booriae TaxID=1552123 RepID=A0A842FSG1_9LIST|nr:Crp/Fnr family transcriptional regulator [Listeria booriae]MBC2283510.1 Crp/Fnr family transcriptional regulator [Listeria booriae]MBC2291695.1 Crp/Fnr family transcriptional regulator [Listeria booriae]